MFRFKWAFVLVAALLAFSQSAKAMEIVIAGSSGNSSIAKGHGIVIASGSDHLTGRGWIAFGTEVLGTRIWRFELDSGYLIGRQVFLEGYLTLPDVSESFGIQVFVIADADTGEFGMYW